MTERNGQSVSNDKHKEHSSQAEIAGGEVTPTGELPTKGRQLPNFELTCLRGQPIRLSDYRGRRNLVLVFTDERPATAEVLSAMAERQAEFENEGAEIIVIAQPSRGESGHMKELLKLPYPVLVDESGLIHRNFGASDPHGCPAAALYVTDRFLEVFAMYRTQDGQALPGAKEVFDWLEFINSQCPECEPPEWPV